MVKHKRGSDFGEGMTTIGVTSSEGEDHQTTKGKQYKVDKICILLDNF